MIKNALLTLLVIGLVLLGAGLYLGYIGMGQMSNSYSAAMAKEKELGQKLQEENKKLQTQIGELQKSKKDLEDNLAEKEKLVSQLMGQSANNLVLEEQVKAIQVKMQETVDSCVIKPKPKVVHHVAKKVVKPAPKVVEKIVVKEVEKPAKTQTIVINKIYVQKDGHKARLIKQDRVIKNGSIPDSYPNDLLK